MTRTRLRSLGLMATMIALTLPLFPAGEAWARPQYWENFKDKYNISSSLSGKTCGVCHNSDAGGDARNNYGQAYESNLNGATDVMNATTIKDALNDIETDNSDSDNDGLLNPCFNIMEIVADTLPGDGSSKPASCSRPNAEPDPGSDDLITTDKDSTPISINVLANDTHATGHDLTVKNFDSASAQAAAGANNVSCDTTIKKSSGNPACTYSPPTGFCGLDTFTYDVSDGSFTSSSTAAVTINVGDTNAPSVTAPTPAPLVITRPAGSTGPVPATDATIADWLTSATATDDEDGALTPTNNAPPEFPVGDTAVTFSSSDSCANPGSTSAIVRIQIADNNIPVVTVPAPAPLTVTAPLCATSAPQTATADNFAGTIAEWLATATADDTEDGEITVTNDAPANLPLGNTLVTLTATDSLGAPGRATAGIDVAETPNSAPMVTKPTPDPLVISLPAGSTQLPASDPRITNWLTSASATDIEDGALTPSNDAPADFPIETTVVSFTATDSCGESNAVTSSVTITAQGPVITVQDQREFVATGYLTEVSPDTTATAVDKDGNSIVPQVDDPGPYRPGRHTLIYTATDKDGDTSTTTQRLDILPLVTLAGAQTTAEGRTITVPVTLSGEAATYPITIDYSVSGTADESDHDLVPGSITIDSGTKPSNWTLNITPDAVPEADEQIIITLTGVSDDAVLSDDVVHSILITERNLEPVVSLDIDQAGASGPYIYSSLGTVAVTANATDPNGDNLTFDWSASDPGLNSTAAGNQFSLDPATPGSYHIAVMISDGVNQVAHTATLVVVGETTELSETQRSDADKDRLPNYLDAVDDVTLLQTSVADGDDFKRMIRSDAGVALALGALAIEAQRNGARISMADVIDGSGNAVTDTAFTSIGFVYDFEIHGLSEAQRTTRVVIPLETNTPLNGEYRKLSQGAWHTFIENATDKIRSASSSDGICPPPGATGYQDGLIAFTDCIELTLTDGGPNDADGETNGVIKDPGGVAVPASAPATTSSDLNSSPGGAGALGWLWLMMLAPLLMLQRRFR